MMTFNELKEKWEAMPVYGNGFLLLDSAHHVDINIGYEELNQKTLLIRNSGIVSELPSSKSIAASNYQFADGNWVLSFRLVQNDNEEVFLRLCWDIIESSRDTTKNIIDFIVQRYLKWQRLMEYKRPSILLPARQKGLMGELVFLAECIKTMGLQKALDSWCGPEGADQDFIYDDTWTEVKAATMASATISISSLEQLDTDNEGSLMLYRIDKTTDTDANGFTLKDIVQNTRVLFLDNLKCRELFDLKLFQYGYKDIPEYGKQKYRFCGAEEYRVDGTFPKLTRNNIAYQIISARYAIDLASIAAFRR
jgi:hypothetical protein